MLEVHELIGRDLDPIDDVRRKFERSYTEDYRNPLNGDWISDDYEDIIDLTTQPGELSEFEAARLNRIILRLNGKYDHIQGRLGDSSLLGAYVDVAEQVTTINNTRNSKTKIVPMHGAPKEALPEINDWIANSNNLSKRGFRAVFRYSDEEGLRAEFCFLMAARCFEIAGQLGGVSVQRENTKQVA